MSHLQKRIPQFGNVIPIYYDGLQEAIKFLKEMGVKVHSINVYKGDLYAKCDFPEDWWMAEKVEDVKMFKPVTHKAIMNQFDEPIIWASFDHLGNLIEFGYNV